jgi:hypothetical protein
MMTKTKTLTVLAKAFQMSYQRVLRAKQNLVIRCSARGGYNIAECRQRIEQHARTHGKNGSVLPGPHDTEMKKWATENLKYKAKLAEKEFLKTEAVEATVISLDDFQLAIDELLEAARVGLTTIARVSGRHLGGGPRPDAFLTEEFRHLLFRLFKTYQVTQGPLSKYLAKKKKGP